MPRIAVELRSVEGERLPFDMKLDSGACITLMNADDCTLLGYRLESGKDCPLRGVGGGIETKVLKLDMRLGSRIFQDISVAFHNSPGVNEDRLFGVMDIYRKMMIQLRAAVSRNSFMSEWP